MEHLMLGLVQNMFVEVPTSCQRKSHSAQKWKKIQTKK